MPENRQKVIDTHRPTDDVQTAQKWLIKEETIFIKSIKHCISKTASNLLQSVVAIHCEHDLHQEAGALSSLQKIQKMILYLTTC